MTPDQIRQARSCITRLSRVANQLGAKGDLEAAEVMAGGAIALSFALDELKAATASLPVVMDKLPLTSVPMDPAATPSAAPDLAPGEVAG